MSSVAQVSASSSMSTKDHLNQEEWPDEGFISTRIVLEDDSFEQLIASLEAPPREPSEALRELMRGSGI